VPIKRGVFGVNNSFNAIMSTVSLLLILLAFSVDAAILKVFDLNQQITYQCPHEAELSCAIIWKLNPSHGLLGNSENIFRLECVESAAVDSQCMLPPIFSFNQTKLIKPRMEQKIHNIRSYTERGDFLDLGCPASQTAVCLSLHGQGYKLKATHYILNLRCKDVLEKTCHVNSMSQGDKVLAIIPFTKINVGDMLDGSIL